jgi:hypothetical protein
LPGHAAQPRSAGAPTTTTGSGARPRLPPDRRGGRSTASAP